jgi:hypothetical protein
MEQGRLSLKAYSIHNGRRQIPRSKNETQSTAASVFDTGKSIKGCIMALRMTKRNKIEKHKPGRKLEPRKWVNVKSKKEGKQKKKKSERVVKTQPACVLYKIPESGLCLGHQNEQ